VPAPGKEQDKKILKSVNLPVPIGGLNKQDSPSLFGKNDLVDSNGFIYYDGLIRKDFQLIEPAMSMDKLFYRSISETVICESGVDPGGPGTWPSAYAYICYVPSDPITPVYVSAGVDLVPKGIVTSITIKALATPFAPTFTTTTLTDVSPTDVDYGTYRVVTHFYDKNYNMILPVSTTGFPLSMFKTISYTDNYNKVGGVWVFSGYGARSETFTYAFTHSIGLPGGNTEEDAGDPTWYYAGSKLLGGYTKYLNPPTRWEIWVCTNNGLQLVAQPAPVGTDTLTTAIRDLYADGTFIYTYKLNGVYYYHAGSTEPVIASPTKTFASDGPSGSHLIGLTKGGENLYCWGGIYRIV
jgi:hypothetical protein